MTRLLAVVIAAIFFATPAGAETAEGKAALQLNEDYLGMVRRDAPVDPDDVLSVFAFVFGRLADEVTVLPTENYYYFGFFHGGAEWAGNIRLDVIDRDEGVVHFAYFERTAPWIGNGVTRYRQLVEGDGVALARAGPLAYDLTFGGRTVRFHLNDLSDVKPPDHAVRPDETYLGPVYDESGIEFYLLFDRVRKTFVYVLNESRTVADAMVPLAGAPEIVIGRRTGFAFYRDARVGRKVLVGVHSSGVANNSYFDGPFDQLPDNFVDREVFRASLEAAYPEVKGKIDDFGNFAGGEGRVLVNPYRVYTRPSDLAAVSDCAAAATDEAAYYRCLAPAE